MYACAFTYVCINMRVRVCVNVFTSVHPYMCAYTFVPIYEHVFMFMFSL